MALLPNILISLLYFGQVAFSLETNGVEKIDDFDRKMKIYALNMNQLNQLFQYMQKMNDILSRLDQIDKEMAKECKDS